MINKSHANLRRSLLSGVPSIAAAIVLSGLLPPCAAPSWAAAGPLNILTRNPYKVLAPLESGDLTIFPVVRQEGEVNAQRWQYITLDEGLKNGQVIVTEAGNVMGLIRSRHPGRPPRAYTGDEVNRLVLVNNSSRPLLLLAGEIVTGGKQDRVIGKDRIVPAQSDPIDLSVFCIEPGRWVGQSSQFGAAGKPSESFMVQPAVRKQAMAAQNQQEVWNAVGKTINGLASAAVAAGPPPPHTTSYAAEMQSAPIQKTVDKTAAPLLASGEALRTKLGQERAVGVVVAVRGKVIWADLFADTDMLEKYWTKLIRSYAAEAVTEEQTGAGKASIADAQHFLELGTTGHETSEGETGIYQYSEIRAGGVDSFVLQALLPDTGFNVHISKIVLAPEDAGGAMRNNPIPRPRFQPQF
ncbi:MAG TPA: DUF6569 family protein [Terracidiphilus sp.]